MSVNFITSGIFVRDGRKKGMKKHLIYFDVETKTRL